MISYATCESTIIYSSFPDSFNQSGDLKIDWRCTPTQKQILEDFGNGEVWTRTWDDISLGRHHPFTSHDTNPRWLQFLSSPVNMKIRKSNKKCNNWLKRISEAGRVIFGNFTQCETPSESHESVERQKEWGRMIRLKTFKVNCHLFQSKITIFVGERSYFFSASWLLAKVIVPWAPQTTWFEA